MKPDPDLFKFLKQKALWVRQETLKIHKIAPGTRLASSLSDVEIFAVLKEKKRGQATFLGNRKRCRGL